MDLTQLTDQLYVGGQISLTDWYQLSDEGITAVVNLQIEKMDHFVGRAPEAYLWLPCVDGTAPSLQQLIAGADFINACIGGGNKVLVHCAAGVGRSPLVCAAYFMLHCGMTAEQAWSLIRSRRPWVSGNLAQHERLQELQEWALSPATARRGGAT